MANATTPATSDTEASVISNIVKGSKTVPKILDADFPLISEMRLLNEGMRNIKQQNWNIEAKLSALSESMSKKFDRLERRYNTKNDEAAILRQSLLENQNKLDDTMRTIKGFLFCLVVLGWLYFYLIMASKQRFDWSEVFQRNAKRKAALPRACYLYGFTKQRNRRAAVVLLPRAT